MTELPALDAERFVPPTLEALGVASPSAHPPRILLLYGSLRERSFSRFLTQEAARLLDLMGCETRIFDPRDLPLPDATGPDHPKVQELRALSQWSEARSGAVPSATGRSPG